MGDLSLDGIRQKIRAAFPAQVFSGVVTECACDECVEISDGMRFKSWDQIPEAFLDANPSLPLLSPEAFRAFLPAHLLRGLDPMKDNVVGEFAVYCLCPDPEPGDRDDPERGLARTLERRALMNGEQIDAIRAFLTYFAGKDASLTGEFAKLGLASVWLDSTKRTGE